VDIEVISMKPPRRGVVTVNPHTNFLVAEGDGGSVSVRTYFGPDVLAAIHDWGRLNDQPPAIEDAMKVVKRVLEASKTSIHEVFYPESRQYVTVVGQCNLYRGAAFINRGFVDHHVQLPESTPHKHLFRSKLHTFREKSGSKAVEKIPYEVCARCSLRVPVTGECQCGWAPTHTCSDWLLVDG
jgi:hypothetical protein